MVVVPSYPHNALFYSDYFSYCDPHYAGIFDALTRDFLTDKKGDALSEALLRLTWGMRWGMIMHEHEGNTTKFEWFHEPMACPTSPKSLNLFQSKWYTQERTQTTPKHTFSTDHDLLSERLEEAGITPYSTTRFEAWRDANEGHPLEG